MLRFDMTPLQRIYRWAASKSPVPLSVETSVTGEAIVVVISGFEPLGIRLQGKEDGMSWVLTESTLSGFCQVPQSDDLMGILATILETSGKEYRIAPDYDAEATADQDLMCCECVKPIPDGSKFLARYANEAVYFCCCHNCLGSNRQRFPSRFSTPRWHLS